MTTLKKILENIKHHRINGVNVGLSRELEVYHKGVIDNIVINAYKSIIMEEVERLMEQIVGVKELFPEATLNPLDEETAFLVQYKEGHNRAIKDQINYLKDKLNEIE